jgi:hypothetical protein
MDSNAEASGSRPGKKRIPVMMSTHSCWDLADLRTESLRIL